jgi:hypothetical protein
MDPPVPTEDLDSHNRWRIVQSALVSWPRTIRLCLILLTFGVPFDALVLVALR